MSGTKQIQTSRSWIKPLYVGTVVLISQDEMVRRIEAVREKPVRVCPTCRRAS